METTRRVYLIDEKEREKEINKALDEYNSMLDLYSKKKYPVDISDRFTETTIDNEQRNEIIKKVGFTLITDNLLYNLSNLLYGNKCLEIMSGNGSLTKGLQDYGVDILATDNYEMVDFFNNDFWTEVENIDAVDAIDKYGKDVNFVICSWIPYYKPIGYQAIKKLYEVNPKAVFIYIGEEMGGCTADDNFFNYSSEISFSEKMKIDYDNINKISNSLKNWCGMYAKIKFLRYNGKDVKIYR